MSSRTSHEFPDSLLKALQAGAPALLITHGGDDYPGTAFTWVLARHRSALLFGADYGTATLENLEREGRAAIQVIRPGNVVYLLKGRVRRVKERLEAAPFEMGIWVLEVAEVKDQSWPGVSVDPFGYQWSQDARGAMLAMEKAVFAEMRACPL